VPQTDLSMESSSLLDLLSQATEYVYHFGMWVCAEGQQVIYHTKSVKHVPVTETQRGTPTYCGS